MAKAYKSVERRKVIVEWKFKTSGPDFPADHKSETLEEQMSKVLRKHLRKEIPG